MKDVTISGRYPVGNYGRITLFSGSVSAVMNAFSERENSELYLIGGFVNAGRYAIDMDEFAGVVTIGDKNSELNNESLCVCGEWSAVSGSWRRSKSL